MRKFKLGGEEYYSYPMINCEVPIGHRELERDSSK